MIPCILSDNCPVNPFTFVIEGCVSSSLNHREHNSFCCVPNTLPCGTPKIYRRGNNAQEQGCVGCDKGWDFVQNICCIFGDELPMFAGTFSWNHLLQFFRIKSCFWSLIRRNGHRGHSCQSRVLLTLILSDLQSVFHLGFLRKRKLLCFSFTGTWAKMATERLDTLEKNIKLLSCECFYVAWV